jgi:hypothetical protein
MVKRSFPSQLLGTIVAVFAGWSAALAYAESKYVFDAFQCQ